MASPELVSPWFCTADEYFCRSFNVRVEGGNTADIFLVPEAPTSSISRYFSIPEPPPLPDKSCPKAKYPKRFVDCSLAPKETKEAWISFSGKDMVQMSMFLQRIDFCTRPFQYSECCLTSAGYIMQRAKLREGMRCIKILGVPCQAAYTFIRFLYSSCYDEEELKFVLSLLLYHTPTWFRN